MSSEWAKKQLAKREGGREKLRFLIELGKMGRRGGGIEEGPAAGGRRSRRSVGFLSPGRGTAARSVRGRAGEGTQPNNNLWLCRKKRAKRESGKFGVGRSEHERYVRACSCGGTESEKEDEEAQHEFL